MAATFTGKLTGRTAASTDGTATGLIATATVEVHSDGSVRFTDAAGNKHRIMPSASLNALLKMLLVGTGGYAATHKWFGNP
jgi:hypothetical protein